MKVTSFAVVASAAKQSNGGYGVNLDCFGPPASQ